MSTGIKKAYTKGSIFPPKRPVVLLRRKMGDMKASCRGRYMCVAVGETLAVMCEALGLIQHRSKQEEGRKGREGMEKSFIKHHGCWNKI